ncbi:MAG: sugar ABC transporter permease [Chloroflexi bacterium]|nr:MAG: sugar ABC transporter permease [Chloroflexota bacterium]
MPSLLSVARSQLRGRLQSNRRGGELFYVLMVAPIAVYAIAISFYPIIYSLAISFFRYRLTDPSQTRSFIGLDNYVRAINDEGARTAVINTLVFVVGAVALEFALGLGLALLLWRDTRLNKIAAALLLIPISLTPLVSGLVWRAMLNADFGSIGWYLANFLGQREGLTAQSTTAMLAVIIVDAWQWTPLVMLVLLAGLKSLPVEPFEAAQVDGAGRWATVRHLAVPMLAPTIVLALLIRTMDAFKLFDVVFAMTQGGPGLTTTVLNFDVYKQGLVFFDMGYAAALSNILLVMIGIFAVIYIGVAGRQRREGLRVAAVRARA